ncbi:hypothetical protein [Streptomyces sp. NPDC055400]
MAAVEAASISTTHPHPHPHPHPRERSRHWAPLAQHHRATRTDGFLEDTSGALLVITPDANVVTPVAIGAAYMWEKL